jgi:hypothetical protein
MIIMVTPVSRPVLDVRTVGFKFGPAMLTEGMAFSAPAFQTLTANLDESFRPQWHEKPIGNDAYVNALVGLKKPATYPAGFAWRFGFCREFGGLRARAACARQCWKVAGVPPGP